MVIGVAEPSGRLPVTFPASAQDGPAGLGVEGDRYPGIEGRVVYGEGTLVGYRFYETTRLAPLFPFGFGLSYGDMALEDVRTDVVAGDGVAGAGAGDGVSGGGGGGGGGVVVQVAVVNNGTPQGTEVVQVYVRAPESLVRRPDRELVAFAKVTVDAGASETVRLPLDAAAFRYWDVDAHAWRADPGRYELLVGKVFARHLGQHRDHVGRHVGVLTERPTPSTWGRLLVPARSANGMRPDTTLSSVE